MKSWLYVGRDTVDHEVHEIAGGAVSVCSRRAPDKTTSNEDGTLVVRLAAEQGVLAVADGVGGQAIGEAASAAALEALGVALAEAVTGEVVLREAVLRGFEAANEAVIRLAGDAATTLIVAQIQGRGLRSYHVGDSTLLVVGQRGRRRLLTVAHSPSGFAVEAGLLDEAAAVHDEDRHLVLNLLGDPEMRIDMSAEVDLAPRDTVVLASDGLFDNLYVEEIAGLVRTGPLARASRRLAEAASRRMATARPDAPSKPDDLTFLLYRPTADRPARPRRRGTRGPA